MIDLHCHLLPGVDDGPASLAQAVDLARALVAQGVERVAATPHMLDGQFDVTLEGATAARQQLIPRLQQEGLPLEVLPGAEHWVSERLLAAARSGDVQVLGSSSYLLIELPFDALAIPPFFEQLLFDLRLLGLRPILAHPERYPGLQDPTDHARVHRWVEHGLLLQVNADALVRADGPAGRTARGLLLGGLVHLVASDAHRADTRPPRGREAAAVVDRLLGPDAVEQLFSTNPAHILADQSVTAARPEGRRRSWLRRFLNPSGP